ncbi:MAG: Gfo/Idh/MocA family oxidoreductase [Planctomycetia bacterium]|nr:Gfo/Idh/MocA family oxidoreductase [Planctomycetia bacterium]
MSTRLNRRRFVQLGTAGSLGYLFTGPAFSVTKAYGANDRLRVAGIGVGGKGSSDIDHAGSLMEVVGLCDVDKDYLGNKQKKWPMAKAVQDFRKLFDDAEFMKTVDAFTISTPDHMHALPAAMAMRAKKHVYVQKPLARTVFENDLLRKVAKANGVCTQMGNQGTTLQGLRRAVELVHNGTLGHVKEVHVWTNRPVWPQAPTVMKRYEPVDAPAYLDWQSYLGPAPERPYAHGPNKGKRGCYHDFNWRGWWTFGTGAIGDMACHTANMAFMACKLQMPVKVSATATDVNDETCPSSAHVVLEFPARGDLPPVTVHWYEGKDKDGKKLQPPEEWVKKALAIDTDEKRKKALVNSGSIIIGEKGYIYSPSDYGAEVFFGPEEAFKGINTKTPEKFKAWSGDFDLNNKKEWVEAIKAGKPDHALSNFDYAGYLAGAFVLGNVAIRTGQAFEFNAETLECKGNKDAAQYIKYEYRKGWDMLEEKA